MPKGRWPASSSAPGGSAPSAGTGSPSGGVPGTVSPPRPAQPAAPGQPAAWARAGLDPGAAEHLLADLVPFLPSPGYPQHAAHELLVSVERAHRLSDGDPFGRPNEYLRLVTGPDRAFG